MTRLMALTAGSLLVGLSLLTGAAEAATFIVNCATGQTIERALKRGRGPEPLLVIVVGTCVENVTITIDDVTLQGDPAVGGEVMSQDPEGNTILINGARRVGIFDLTLSAGSAGLRAIGGASVLASNVVITGATTFGIIISNNSFLDITDLTISGASEGLRADSGASFFASNANITGAEFAVVVTNTATGILANSTVLGNRIGIGVSNNSFLEVSGGEIANSTDEGVSAAFGGHVQLRDGVVLRNSGGPGIVANGGGSVEIIEAVVKDNTNFGVIAGNGGSASITGSETVVRDNGGGGVLATFGGSVAVASGAQVVDNNSTGVVGFVGGNVNIANATVSGNLGRGVDLSVGSTAQIGGSKIQTNTGDGIFLKDTSVVLFNPGNTITGNGGWGILCDQDPDAVALISNGGLPIGTVQNNAAGQINCPFSG